MLKKKSNKLIAIMLSVLLSGLIPAVITLADNLIIDGDGLVPVSENSSLNFGDLTPGSTTTKNVYLAIKRNGQGNNVFANSTDITVSHIDNPNDFFDVEMADKFITTIENWVGAANNAITEDTAIAKVKIAIPANAVPGNQQSATLSFTASGKNVEGTDFDRTGTLNVTYKVVRSVDTTPPTASHTLSPDVWTNGTVKITVTAQDLGSGLKSISGPAGTTVNGSTAMFTTSINDSFTFRLEDNAGNISNYVVVVDKIDKTAPSLTPDVSSTVWTKNPVEISVTAEDLGSGIKTITGPSGTVVTGKTATYTATSNGKYTFTAEDLAGNTAEYEFTVGNIDTKAPSATHTSDPDDWTKGNVLVTVTASDIGSGLASLRGPEGTLVTDNVAVFTAMENKTYYFFLEDKVGNTSTHQVEVKYIDTTAPSAEHTLSTYDWTNKDVTITVNAEDTGSGLATITGPTGTMVNGATAIFTANANGKYTFKLTDNVGNTKDYDVIVDNIDKIDPEATSTLDPNGWTNGDVTISVNATDMGGSKVKSITDPMGNVTNGATVDYTVEANGTYEFIVEDNAGNTFKLPVEVEEIDRVKPTASSNIDPVSSIWTNGNVKILVTGDDDASGVESISILQDDEWNILLPLLDGATDKSKKAEYTVSVNGTYVFLVKDKAGNSIEHSVVVTNIDKTKPVIDIITPVDGAVYKVNEVILANWRVVDNESGLALSPSATTANGVAIDTKTAGNKSFTVSAIDIAGNPESKTVYYTVIYEFNGFFQPIEMGKLNSAKAGSSIPIKFSLNGYHGMDIFKVAPKAYTYNVIGNTVDTNDVEAITTAGKSDLSYDPVTDQYTYVWKTDKGWATYGRQLSIILKGGTEHTVNFKFK